MQKVFTLYFAAIDKTAKELQTGTSESYVIANLEARDTNAISSGNGSEVC